MAALLIALKVVAFLLCFAVGLFLALWGLFFLAVIIAAVRSLFA